MTCRAEQQPGVCVLAGKMSAGIPLTDEDRLPWLQQLAELLHVHGAR
jgi:hypothetical protein